MSINQEQAKAIVRELITKTQQRFGQELAGENEEFLDRILRTHRGKMARHSWKAAQKWCKFNNEGPVLMPDNTRIYYRKGETEVLLQEFAPQIRLMRFMGSLAKREDSEAECSEGTSEDVYSYSLALPYVVFIFKFQGGMFQDVKCAFSDRPLKRLEEKPLRPYFSNIDNTLKVCLGRDFDKKDLEKDNLTQQAAFVLSHFWQSVFKDEWSQHYWNCKSHFKTNYENLASLEAWEKASLDNPLFVIEDAPWLKHDEEMFGDMIVRCFDGGDHSLQEELYNELSKNFLEDIVKSMGENIKTVESKVLEAIIDELAQELVEKVS